MEMNPKAIPVGEVLKTVFFRADSRADFLLDATNRLGDVLRVPVPGKKIYLISHPRDVKRALVEKHASVKKSFDYRVLSAFTGQGLVTSDGETWKRDRRMIQPLFLPSALQTLGETAREVTQQWMNGLRARASSPMDIFSEMTGLALQIIGRKVFSQDILELQPKFEKGFVVAQKHITRRILSIVDFSRWVPTLGRIQFEKSLREMDQWIEAMISKRKTGPQSGKGERDLLGLLIDARDPESGSSLTHSQIRDQIVTLFFAGHETTALAMTWVLHLLGLHPEYQERVHREVLADSNPETWVFLKACIRETLRLYPPIALFGRELAAPLELGGTDLEAGSTILIAPYVTHRRADLWEKADVFMPERFLGESARELERSYAYYPFGAGPRVCIGKTFAEIEMATILGALLREFRFRPADREKAAGIRGALYITLRPNAPVSMQAEPTV